MNITLYYLLLTVSLIHGWVSGKVSRSCSVSMAAKLSSSMPPAFDTSRCLRIRPRDWTSRMALADMVRRNGMRGPHKTEIFIWLPKTVWKDKDVGILISLLVTFPKSVLLTTERKSKLLLGVEKSYQVIWTKYYKPYFGEIYTKFVVRIFTVIKI